METQDQSTKKSSDKEKLTKGLRSYAKYSGIAFQMAAIIFLGTLGGYKLNSFFNFELPILTVILSLLSVILAIYLSVKDFLKK